MACPNSETNLTAYVERCTINPLFCGWAVRQFALRHSGGFVSYLLIMYLDCEESNYQRLAASRRPRVADPEFRQRVTEIAAYASCDAENLESLLREVEGYGEHGHVA